MLEGKKSVTFRAINKKGQNFFFEKRRKKKMLKVEENVKVLKKCDFWTKYNREKEGVSGRLLLLALVSAPIAAATAAAPAAGGGVSKALSGDQPGQEQT